MEKISWTDRVKDDVMQSLREEKNIPHTIKRWKANWIGHVVRKIGRGDEEENVSSY